MDLKKTPAWDFALDVNEICQPMFKAYGLNYFHYSRLYPGGSVLYLDSDRLWAEHFCRREHPLAVSYMPEGSCLINETNASPIILSDARIFKHDHYFSICQYKKYYQEFACVATEPTNLKIYHFYLHQQEALHQFLLYFKEKAHYLIEAAEKKRIIFTKTQLSLGNYKRTEITKKTIQFRPKNYWVSGNHGPVKISQREMRCVEPYTKGFSAKQIGRHLNLSHRTVETHIEHVKTKLGVSTRFEVRALIALI
jgi:DNA-binding CsgD family transcriptional regulator